MDFLNFYSSLPTWECVNTRTYRTRGGRKEGKEGSDEILNDHAPVKCEKLNLPATKLLLIYINTLHVCCTYIQHTL